MNAQGLRKRDLPEITREAEIRKCRPRFTFLVRRSGIG
jgi:hypothetical protein